MPRKNQMLRQARKEQKMPQHFPNFCLSVKAIILIYFSIEYLDDGFRRLFAHYSCLMELRYDGFSGESVSAEPAKDNI